MFIPFINLRSTYHVNPYHVFCTLAIIMLHCIRKDRICTAARRNVSFWSQWETQYCTIFMELKLILSSRYHIKNIIDTTINCWHSFSIGTPILYLYNLIHIIARQSRKTNSVSSAFRNRREPLRFQSGDIAYDAKAKYLTDLEVFGVETIQWWFYGDEFRVIFWDQLNFMGQWDRSNNQKGNWHQLVSFVFFSTGPSNDYKGL